MRFLIILLTLMPLIACQSSPVKGKSQIANPASVKCIEDGHRLEIRKDEEGNEYGVCIDAKGNECEEWAYFRGECMLGAKGKKEKGS